MSEENLPKIHVSAPGKVLITGGYLVLIPPASGLVLSTTARFHSWVQLHRQQGELMGDETPKDRFDCFSNANNSNNNTNHSNENFIDFLIKSPQFKQELRYRLIIRPEEVELKTESGLAKNPFIELPLLYSIVKWWEHGSLTTNLPPGLWFEIEIAADNDYYSQSEGKALTLEERRALPERVVPAVWPIQKTGLGSSAGLVTSLTAGLRKAFKDFVGDHSLDTEIDIHRLSQFIHGLAQGKVGSGFDVSAAVYGSQRYLRFPPEVLQKVMDKTRPDNLICSKDFKDELESMLSNSSEWVYSRTLYSLPSGFNMFVADVKGGSETPGMVRKVLDWKKHHEGADKLWNHIDGLNKKLDDCFGVIHELQKEDRILYESTIELLSEHSVEKWGELDNTWEKLRSAMLEARECYSEIRAAMKRMGDESDVEIEPDSQSVLLDETMRTPGCLFAGVPGAGGYDAIFSINFGARSRQGIERVWSDYSDRNNLIISPLLLEESKGEGLHIDQYS